MTLQHEVTPTPPELASVVSETDSYHPPTRRSHDPHELASWVGGVGPFPKCITALAEGPKGPERDSPP